MGGDHLYSCKHCEENPYYLSVLGHDGPPTGMWDKNLVDDQLLERCPMRTLLDAKREAIREIEMYETEIYPFWKKGFLLHAGSVGDQPAREIAYFREFDRMSELTQLKYNELTRPDGSGGDVQ